jgi:hypothetical protein
MKLILKINENNRYPAYKAERPDLEQSSQEYRRLPSQRYVPTQEYTESLDEGPELLRELEEWEFDKVRDVVENVDVDDLSFDNIFKGRKRFAVPFDMGVDSDTKVLLEFLNRLGGEIDLQAGTISKEVETRDGGKQVRTTKIGKILTKYQTQFAKHAEIHEEFRLAHAGTARSRSALGTAYVRDPNSGFNEKYGSFANLWDANPEKLEKDLLAWAYSLPATERVGSYNENAHALAKQLEETSKAALDITPKYWQSREKMEKQFSDYEKIDDALKDPKPMSFGVAGVLKTWQEKGEFYRSNPRALEGDSETYSLLVSRAPIDVLRMSDFDDIMSCHSPPSRERMGDYYQCAVEEARGHGPIVYVVKTEDLQGVDLEADEVFVDSKRRKEGLKPISRARIRKYVHKESNSEVAVPELRTYGKSFPTLLPQVTELFKGLQPDVPEGPPADFHKYGGSYSDTPDYEVFNNFFDTRSSYGDGYSAHIRGDEGEFEDYLNDGGEEELEAAAEEIENRFSNFEHTDVGYSVEYDPETYLSFHAVQRHDFDLDVVQIAKKVGKPPDDVSRFDIMRLVSPMWSSFTNAANKPLNASPMYGGQFNAVDHYVEGEHMNFTLNLRCFANGSGDAENDFRTFLEENCFQMDEAYEQINYSLRQLLIEQGIMRSSAFDDLYNKAEDGIDTFENFDVSIFDENVSVDIDPKKAFLISVAAVVDKEKVSSLGQFSQERQMYSNGIREKVSETLKSRGFRSQFLSLVADTFESGAEQLQIPGFEATQGELSFREEPDSFRFKGTLASFDSAVWEAQIHLEMSLKFTDFETEAMDERHIARLLKFFRLIDDNFNKFAELLQKAFNEHVEGVDTALKMVSSILGEVDEVDEMIKQTIKEVEPYQKEMKKKHPKWKKMTIGMGGNKSTGGGPYTKKPSMKRSKSAPPGGA